MTNTITAAAKTAAGIAARLAAAAIMSTLVLGSAVIPAKAATPTEAITVPGTAVHPGTELGERLRRTTVVNQLTCRTLSGFTAGAVPPPRSCDRLSASPATRLAGAAPAGARFQD